eukprot:m.85136 g.85136  ORF g.85136 m.85136 type:complete len:595 (-) comp25835_c0_seq2:324-2108(-)
MFTRFAKHNVATVRSLVAFAPKPRFFSVTAYNQAAIPVVGCGSNVVDLFLRLRALPKPGEKGFFASPTSIVEATIVGGVTLNHLSWANLLGVPTGGMFLQGNDPSGIKIRNEMEKQGLSTQHVVVSDEYTTAESYVLLQEDGERSIIMASGSTSQITAEVAQQHFDQAIKNSKIFTTEISQVPLSGVLHMLQTAKKNKGTVSVLDVDVQPSVAVDEARLGTLDEILDCVREADVLKPAKHAALELLGLLRPQLIPDLEHMTALEVAQQLQKATKCKLVALTDGGAGCALATASLALMVEPATSITVTDATGAGDAFLGGLVAVLYHDGLPETIEDLQKLGAVANTTGASCCQVLGGLPDSTSGNLVTSLLKGSFGEKYSSFLTTPSVDDQHIDTSTHTDLLTTAFATSITHDIKSLHATLQTIDYSEITRFIEIIHNCKGRVLTTGLGKSGMVARRMAVSLSSIGHPSHFVHASEWGHGDLGACTKDDVVVMFSNSGNTDECVYAIHHIKLIGAQVLSVTAGASSKMALSSDANVVYTIPTNLEPVGGAPTASVVVQEAVINATMHELIARTSFTAKDFKVNHPGGSLGISLPK